MIAPVPLFIKAPGQRRGRTIRSYVRTVDVVPTIADILNISPGYRGRRALRVLARGRAGGARAGDRARLQGRHPHLGAARSSGGGAAFVRRKLRLFGVGPEERRGLAPLPRHRAQPRAARPPAVELATAAAAGARARLGAREALADVDLESELRPVHIAGSDLPRGARGSATSRSRSTARIEAVSRSFFLEGFAARDLRRGGARVGAAPGAQRRPRLRGPRPRPAPRCALARPRLGHLVDGVGLGARVA